LRNQPIRALFWDRSAVGMNQADPSHGARTTAEVMASPIASFIEQSFFSVAVTRVQMDRLWRKGWRHFGPYFVRYSISAETGEQRVVQPLRLALDRFHPSKTHRRLLRRNADLEVRIGPVTLDQFRHGMFDRHKRRFTANIPQSLYDFLGPDPRLYPCELVEVGVYEDGRLLAASYLDIGREGASGVYAMFEPADGQRALGIHTMLLEIEYARRRGCRYYYPGYAFHEPSLLDYKKQFVGTEWFDWQGTWLPLAGREGGPRAGSRGDGGAS